MLEEVPQEAGLEVVLDPVLVLGQELALEQALFRELEAQALV